MTAGDEMCNLYIMYYSPSSEDDFRVCVDEEIPGVSKNIPASSDDRLPPYVEPEDANEVPVEVGPPKKTPAPQPSPGSGVYYSLPRSKIRAFHSFPPQPILPSNYGYGYPQPYVPLSPPQQPPPLVPVQHQPYQSSHGYQQPVYAQVGGGGGGGYMQYDSTNTLGGNDVGDTYAAQGPLGSETLTNLADEDQTTKAPEATEKPKTKPRRPISSIHGVQGLSCLHHYYLHFCLFFSLGFLLCRCLGGICCFICR